MCLPFGAEECPAFELFRTPLSMSSGKGGASAGDEVGSDLSPSTRVFSDLLKTPVALGCRLSAASFGRA
jgi:hypothetical protein